MRLLEGLPESDILDLCRGRGAIFPAAGKTPTHDETIRPNELVPILWAEDVEQFVDDLVQHGGCLAQGA